MAYTQYNKGSEWRIWDLQVHTPFSFLNNGFGDDWDKYVKELFKRAIENNVAAIAITDYFTIDGYKKIKNDYLNNSVKMAELFSVEEIAKIQTIYILPNVEFRLNKLVGANRINFHVLFSHEVSINDIEENFLHDLDFVYEAGPQSEDEKRKLKLNNLIQLGEKLIAQHAKFRDRSPVFIGMMNAVVDDTQISSILFNKKKIFEDKYLLALPCDEDLSGVSWDAQDHQARKILIQKADILIASNPKTIDWALGKFNASEAEFITEFKSIKPCVFGSDAHTFDEMFVKNKDRKTWIKADPDFVGLKQIVYEAHDRVKIQGNSPENKTGYQIIDRIEIHNPSNYNSKIEFNPNLNSIIGGRSTGKSILLGAIAKKLKTVRPIEYHDLEYDQFVQSVSQTIKVFWKDGQEQNDREIEYFKQGYMHDIARDDNKLSKIIQDILYQKGKERLLNNYNKSITENSKKISALVNDYFQVRLEIREKEQKARDKGDRKGVEDEILKLQGELTALNITEITKEEKVIYEELKEKENEIVEERARLATDVQQLSLIKDVNLFKDSISYESTSLSERKRFRVDGLFRALKIDYTQRWSEALKGIIESTKSLDEKQLFLLEEIKANTIFIKVSKAFADNIQLAEYEQKIKFQKGKLFEINTLIEEIHTLNKQKKEISENIRFCHMKFHENLNELLPQLADTNDGLKIQPKPKFNVQKYQEMLSNALNQQGYENQAIANFKYENNQKYEDHIFGLMNKLVIGSVTLKGGYTSQALLSLLMSNSYYELAYDIEYEGDNFKKMSDGKKAFVVLKLLLDFSDKDCPILIDQPEDDLDNRAIYVDLVRYLRKKKKIRQIIVATHSPNIVVGADSELVICANQHGDKNPNIGAKKFQYVSGSLEHTFNKIEGKQDVLEAQGMREHVCEVLEGGNLAFKLREKKYAIKS